MRHVTDEEIGLFLSGRLEPDEVRRVVRHLIGRCLRCRARIGRYAEAFYAAHPRPIDPPPPEERFYDAPIDRAIARALAEAPRWLEEQRQVAEIVAAVRRHPQALAGLAELDEGLPQWAMVEAVIELSREARYRDPREMLRLAFAARLSAAKLDPERYGPGLTADLQARAWAELGNAWRVNEELDSAEDAFAHARAALRNSTGDPLVRARVLDLEASLLRVQRRLREADELLDEVHWLYMLCGDRHLAGRALIKKGINVHYDGRPREAVTLLREGISMLQPGQDPQLAVHGQEGLLHALVDCGKLREARRLLLESGLRQKLAAEPLNLLKLRWVEGKIYRGLGKLEQAEAAFEEARAGFLLRGLSYDAALLGLELIEVWLRQDRSQEARWLAQEVRETLEDLNVQREARRAVAFLEEVCRQDAATPGLVQQIVEFLKRLEWEPRLQFVPSGFG